MSWKWFAQQLFALALWRWFCLPCSKFGFSLCFSFLTSCWLFNIIFVRCAALLHSQLQWPKHSSPYIPVSFRLPRSLFQPFLSITCLRPRCMTFVPSFFLISPSDCMQDGDQRQRLALSLLSPPANLSSISWNVNDGDMHTVLNFVPRNLCAFVNGSEGRNAHTDD